MNVKSKYLLLSLPVVFIMGCNGCKNQNGNTTINHNDTTHVNEVASPALSAFNADSAYVYTKKQVDFGPRVPGTEAHSKCLQFLIDNLKRDGLNVTIQESTAKTYDGKHFKFENVIASSDTQNHSRILLCGHWDTRPFADLDTVDPEKPFDGADDGASSAAVLLEIGRHLKQYPAGVGVDLVFFDLEDYGQQTDDDFPHMQDSWALGSQYWAKNLSAGYAQHCRFGILLDMVGGKDAVFPMEGTSMHYAPDVVSKIWKIAGDIGYGNYFTYDKTTATTDDHTYVNELSGIPTIDIVDYRMETHDYPYFHHKHSDSMNVIDTTTLHVVGRVLMKVIYSEKSGQTPQS
ncbi:MAG TPA: M28 family peptidase [Bacteroidia bacterium]|jgi:glutaminyl-peptide cyclotransferase|nr:M28 family peptidase [Bacteroidia bacterium]